VHPAQEGRAVFCVILVCERVGADQDVVGQIGVIGVQAKVPCAFLAAGSRLHGDIRTAQASALLKPAAIGGKGVAPLFILKRDRDQELLSIGDLIVLDVLNLVQVELVPVMELDIMLGWRR
jgi:hypothetical protein